jgi:hypothetical protein
MDMSSSAQRFIRDLLIRKPDARLGTYNHHDPTPYHACGIANIAVWLGCGPLGTSELTSHPFFKGINWADLVQKKVIPPYVPAARDIAVPGISNNKKNNDCDDTSGAATPSSTSHHHHHHHQHKLIGVMGHLPSSSMIPPSPNSPPYHARHSSSHSFTLETGNSSSGGLKGSLGMNDSITRTGMNTNNNGSNNIGSSGINLGTPIHAYGSHLGNSSSGSSGSSNASANGHGNVIGRDRTSDADTLEEITSRWGRMRSDDEDSAPSTTTASVSMGTNRGHGGIGHGRNLSAIDSPAMRSSLSSFIGNSLSSTTNSSHHGAAGVSSANMTPSAATTGSSLPPRSKFSSTAPLPSNMASMFGISSSSSMSSGNSTLPSSRYRALSGNDDSLIDNWSIQSSDSIFTNNNTNTGTMGTPPSGSSHLRGRRSSSTSSRSASDDDRPSTAPPLRSKRSASRRIDL